MEESDRDAIMAGLVATYLHLQDETDPPILRHSTGEFVRPSKVRLAHAISAKGYVLEHGGE